MNRILVVTATLVLLAAGLGDPAWAQIPQFQSGPQTGTGGPTLRPSTRPVVSSYAGLLGSGVGANSAIGYQYFTRVQPQIAASRALNNLGRSVNRLQAENLGAGGLTSLTADQQLATQRQLVAAGIGPTGHPISYFSHLAYFGTNVRGSSGAGTGAGFGTTGAGASASSSPARR
jgi:hypothetical protein